MSQSVNPEEDLGRADLAVRLDELEARVELLEGRDQVAPSTRTATARAITDRAVSYDPEVFWALEGLRARTEGNSSVLLTGTVELPTGERADWQEGFLVDALLEADWSHCADTVAALGHPIRLLLLREVLRGVRTTADLGAIEELGTSGQLYHHLRQLVTAGWLRASGRGRYEVPPQKVVPLLVIIGGTQP